MVIKKYYVLFNLISVKSFFRKYIYGGFMVEVVVYFIYYYLLITECLEIPEDIVEALQTLLIAISCQKQLNHQRFSDYCAQTARLWVSRFPWYPMPQAVHRLVIHGMCILVFFENKI